MLGGLNVNHEGIEALSRFYSLMGHMNTASAASQSQPTDLILQALQAYGSVDRAKNKSTVKKTPAVAQAATSSR